MEPLVLHEYAALGQLLQDPPHRRACRLPLERREYDIMQGETRTPEFLAEVNANGRIPVLQVGDRFLPESNAACWYLADGTPLIPDDRFDQADMLRWMFWEQYNHEPNVATLRFWFGWIGEANFTEFQRAALPLKREAGLAALRLMDEHCRQRLPRRRALHASPTSRSTPTPTRARRAATGWPTIRRSRPGSRGSPRCPATCRSADREASHSPRTDRELRIPCHIAPP